MAPPRFFIPKTAIDSLRGKIVCKDERLFNKITNVLRLKVGDWIIVLDGLGSLYHCQLETSPKGEIIASIEQSLKIEEQSQTLVHIAMPLLKSGRFEWALEKLTELGVAKISPIILERSVVRLDCLDRQESQAIFSKSKRWEAILKEAAQQCERLTIPQLVPPRNFAAFILDGSLARISFKFILSERREVPHLARILGNIDTQALLADVVIAVGAEGGFTDSELENAISFGFVPVSLGHRILRSETAAIYALTIVACQYGAKE